MRSRQALSPNEHSFHEPCFIALPIFNLPVKAEQGKSEVSASGYQGNVGSNTCFRHGSNTWKETGR